MDLFISIILWIAYFSSLYFSIFMLLVYFDKNYLLKNEKSSLNSLNSLNLKNYPFVSILVPAYNEEKTIVKTLESVNNLNYPKNSIEIIVIDDGSKDQTKNKISGYIKDKPHFHLMSHPNMGKAASMNKALQEAKGEFFACLDADSFVDPLTLKKMLSLYYQENDPKIAIITPAMKVDNPKNLLQKMQWLEYLVIILVARISSHLDSLYVAPGPFSLYKTEIIRKIGGFEPRSITEDQEIAYRIQLYQYKIRQCFDGYVYTTAPSKIKLFYSQRRRWYIGSLICLYQYKDMIANKKYGDFGIMQMTKSAFGYILAIGGIIISLYFLLLPLMTKIKDLFLINFNFIPYILNFKITLTTLKLMLADFKFAFIVGILFIIGFFLFYQAHKNANEKIMKFGLIPLVPYFAFYYLLKGVILISSLLEFSHSKKVKCR